MLGFEVDPLKTEDKEMLKMLNARTAWWDGEDEDYDESELLNTNIKEQSENKFTRGYQPDFNDLYISPTTVSEFEI